MNKVYDTCVFRLCISVRHYYSELIPCTMMDLFGFIFYVFALIMVTIIQNYYTPQSPELINRHRQQMRLQKESMKMGKMSALDYRNIKGDVDCGKLEKLLRTLVLMEKPITSRKLIFIYLEICVDKSDEEKCEATRRYYEQFLRKHGLEMESETEALTRMNTEKNRAIRRQSELDDVEVAESTEKVKMKRVRISEMETEVHIVHRNAKAGHNEIMSQL